MTSGNNFTDQKSVAQVSGYLLCSNYTNCTDSRVSSGGDLYPPGRQVCGTIANIESTNTLFPEFRYFSMRIFATKSTKNGQKNYFKIQP